MKSTELEKKLNLLIGKQNHVRSEMKSLRMDVRELMANLILHERAREIIKEVGIKTQQQLQYHISDITSLALDAVFPDPYKVEIDFVSRRNQTECDIYFVRDGNRINPLLASGGGAVDIACFALRIASWTLQNPRTDNTVILDEPMRFVSEEYRESAARMIKEVSDKLNIQFIIVTHEPKLAAFADKTFVVRKKKKVSFVKEQ